MQSACSVAPERVRRALLSGAALLLVRPALAAESDPLPVPQGTPRERAVRLYNEGVRRLLERRHAEAQQLFEQALALDEKMAEAHNNLAYSLRMQSAQNFQRSLRHYDRAIELKPDLAQAYMYRGVLFTQMGNVARARADHARLLGLDRALAARLATAIDQAGGEPDGRAGIAGQYE
ncbi:MAG: hypothetical protein IV097_00555 [Burkholderiaceae bacterium]|nr:hypothetical protein [Burkholderiaceae bacterium]